MAFKTYDIRFEPNEINGVNVRTIGQAIADFYKGRGIQDIVVGRDMRNSSPLIHDWLTYELMGAGLHIIDTGIVSSPNLYYAAARNLHAGALMITGSHLPKDKNGIKVLKEDATPISRGTGIEIIEKLYSQKIAQLSYTSPTAQLSYTAHDFIDDYVRHSIAQAGIEGKELEGLNIVFDGANSMGNQDMKRAFDYLGIKVTYINDTIDGDLPGHEPNPMIERNNRQLIDKVLELKADIGLTGDADFDRVGVVDEQGKTLRGDSIGMLILKSMAGKSHEFGAMYDLRCSRAIKERYTDLDTAMTRVGHSLIKAQMRQYAIDTGKEAFSCELSNHMYFTHDGIPYENPIRALLHILETVKKADMPLSQIVKDLHQGYFHSGEINFEFREEKDKTSALEAIRHQEDYKGELTSLDGVLLEGPDFFLNVRESNTEALLRLNCETRSEEDTKKMIDYVAAMMSRFGGRKKEG